MKTALFILALLMAFAAHGQQRPGLLHSWEDITNKQKYRYAFIDRKGDTVLKLDSGKYYMCFSETMRYFAVVAPSDRSGWWAIDRNEKFLFRVFNAGYGEPNPDEVRNGMIRIIDDSGKVGFANYKGQIVIKPQFDDATSSYKGKAIIGKNCKKTCWSCGVDGKDDGDKHYSTICSQNGYINKHGRVKLLGDYTFEEMIRKIKWKRRTVIL